MIVHSEDSSTKLVSSLSISVALSSDVNSETGSEITDTILYSEELDHSSELSESGQSVSGNRT